MTPHTFTNPSAEGLRAEQNSVSAATPPADCAYVRAGGFSFPILRNAGSPSLRRGATDACHAGVFDGLPPAALGVRALHEQTGGRT